MKPFLLLQLRPEAEASDNEYEAILGRSGLRGGDVRRVRLEREEPPSGLDLDDYSAVIVGGGPGCVSDPEHLKPPLEKRMEHAVLSLMPEIVARDFPYLGCCYGIGILGHHLGGRVSRERYFEPVSVARASVGPDGHDDPLLRDLPESFDIFVGHKEALQELPPGCRHLLSSPACPHQMIRFGENVYATQFHPEADGSVFELRINIYRHKGYFEPHEADELIAAAHKGDPGPASKILRNFVERYG